MTIKEQVNQFQTKYSEGFLQPEIEDILKKFPLIDRKKFDEALQGVTCILRDDEMVFRQIDIQLALYCGIEGRHPSNYEWD